MWNFFSFRILFQMFATRPWRSAVKPRDNAESYWLTQTAGPAGVSAPHSLSEPPGPGPVYCNSKRMSRNNQKIWAFKISQTRKDTKTHRDEKLNESQVSLTWWSESPESISLSTGDPVNGNRLNVGLKRNNQNKKRHLTLDLLEFRKNI